MRRADRLYGIAILVGVALMFISVALADRWYWWSACGGLGGGLVTGAAAGRLWLLCRKSPP